MLNLKKQKNNMIFIYYISKIYIVYIYIFVKKKHVFKKKKHSHRIQKKKENKVTLGIHALTKISNLKKNG